MISKLTSLKRDMGLFKRNFFSYEMSPSRFVSIYSILIISINFKLATYINNHLNESFIDKIFFTISIYFILYGLHNIFLILFPFRKGLKIIASIFLFLNAFTLHFMVQYGTYIDKAMFKSLLLTTPKESAEYLSFPLFLTIFFLAFIPSLFILKKIHLREEKCFIELKKRLIFILKNIIIVSLFFLIANKTFTPFFRSHKVIKHLTIPLNYLDASKVIFTTLKQSNLPKIIISKDAKLNNKWESIKNKTIFILIVGETARVQNFTLAGYAKKTNEFTEKEDKIVFWNNATSCGTATAVSLPCLFSGLPRGDFKDDEKRENLLDIFTKVGFKVIWRDNNTGCQDVCSENELQDKTHFMDPINCNSQSCFDEALLYNLENEIGPNDNKILIILHQLGSHGPAYSLRYPENFKTFLPQCENSEFNNCTTEEIVNAYDNTIHYTDFVIKKSIDFLKKMPLENTALIYVSDHGESLGENGIYLHGLPYLIAPDYQTHIPFLFWSSDHFDRTFSLNHQCLKSRSHDSISHTNLFHSMVGLLDISSSFYNKNYDIFSPCIKI